MRQMLLLLLLLCFAIPASGADSEVVLGATGAIRYDTNVANLRLNNAPDSWGIEIGPRLILRSEGTDFNVSLNYVPTYTYNTNRDIDSEWRQVLGFTAGWEPRQDTRIRASDQFFYQDRNASRSDFDLDPVDPGDEPVLGIADQIRNLASLAVDHEFNPRVTWKNDVSHRLIDNRSPRYTSSTTLLGSTEALYGFSEKIKTGGGVRASYVSVTNPENPSVIQLADGSNSTYITLFGSIIYQFSPRFRFDAAAGPTMIITKIRRSPGVPEAALPNPDDEWTAFARVAFGYEGQKTTATVSYRRGEGVNPFSGLAQTSDSVTLFGRWNPFQNWAFGGRFGFSHRVNSSSVQLIGIDIADRLDQYTVAATASRRIGRRMTGHITLNYLYQQEYFSRLDSDSRDSDRFQIWFRIDYNSAPFRF